MARFRATIKGSRGDASRLGDARTGMTASVNGWDLGVRVVAGAVETDTRGDVFDLYMTSGSNRHATDVYLGRVSLVDGARVFEPAPPPEGRVVDARASAAPERANAEGPCESA
jgi:hypothetical protein